MKNPPVKGVRKPITRTEYDLFSKQCSELLAALKNSSPPIAKIMGLGKFDAKQKNWFICFRPTYWDQLKGEGFGIFWGLRLPPSHTTSKPIVHLNIGVERPIEGEPKETFKRDVIGAASSEKVLPTGFSIWPNTGAKLISKEYQLTQSLAKEVLQDLKNCYPFAELVARRISQFAKEQQGKTTNLSKRLPPAKTKAVHQSKHRALDKDRTVEKSVSSKTPLKGRKVSDEKLKKYKKIVSRRKTCNMCSGLENPSKVDQGSFDSRELGPWTRWQGNLEADILVVGQDWGDVDCLIKNKGIEPHGNPTNRTIMRLFKEALDITLCEPNTEDPSTQPAFFTNSILCLKTGGLQGGVKDTWFENCGRQFLKETIDLIQPAVVVTLGEKAFRAIESLYGKPSRPFRNMVDSPDPIKLPGGSLLFPMYHCGARILNTHRKYPEQLQDWKRIKKYL